MIGRRQLAAQFVLAAILLGAFALVRWVAGF
jgi:hypothetical protein